MINDENRIKKHNEKAENEFFRLLENSNKTISDNEKSIVNLFFLTEDHLSVPEMKKRTTSAGLTVSKPEIKRMIRLLMDYGFAQESKFVEGEEAVYEHRHLSEHHDHMICIKCGKVIEFFVQRLEQLQESISDEFHFYTLNHRMEIYGICGDCQGKREPVMSLMMAAPGEKLVLKEIRGGNEFKNKLSEMGLLPGTPVELVTNSGQVILSVRGFRVAIGRGMASKIFVTAAR